MVTMTCKCGKVSMRFDKLSPKDFPKGWENECCLDSEQELQKIVETVTDILDEDSPPETETLPKRRGRKPNPTN